MKLLIPALLLTSPLFAQNSPYRAQVGPVPTSGYYRINIPPNVLGRLTDGLGNIRLHGAGQYDVPYLLTRQMGAEAGTLVPFAVVAKSMASKQTTLVVQRPAGPPVRSLSVEFTNTNVLKKATLSGSNDRQTWYALDEHIQLGRSSTAQTMATSSVQTLSFPPVDYRYLRLIVIDSASAPLNILRLGNYSQSSTAAQYTPVPGLRFTQRDSSDHYTYLYINRPAPARIDRLTVQVRTATPFRRPVEIGRITTEVIRQRRRQRGTTRQFFEPTTSGTLRSENGNNVLITKLLTTDFCLRIANGDSPPLVVQAVGGEQITTYLTAHLLADSTYLLRFGNPALAAPVYDLTALHSQPAATLPVASVGPVIGSSPLAKGAVVQSLFTNLYLLWGALTGVLVLLGAMTYSLLGSVSKRRRAQ